MKKQIKTLTYTGIISLHSCGDANNILFLSGVYEPLAQKLSQDISRKQVTVRYYITDKQATKEQANENFIKELMGIADVEFDSHYSELSGYLWTDENCVVGGHDLIDELKSHVGKWLILEIDV